MNRLTATLAAALAAVTLTAILAAPEAGTGDGVRYVPAPTCLADDGTIPAGWDACAWHAERDGNGAGRSFVASAPSADGTPSLVREWDGVAPILTPAR